jgi:hypothetical protein
VSVLGTIALLPGSCLFLLNGACADMTRRQAMIDEFDLDQDGEINEQEFFAIMTDDA